MMIVEIVACCGRKMRFREGDSAQKCGSCGLRVGAPIRRQLRVPPGLSPRAMRATEALLSLGGRAGVKAVASLAHMTPREAGIHLASAGCEPVRSYLRGREVKQWVMPARLIL